MESKWPRVQTVASIIKALSRRLQAGGLEDGAELGQSGTQDGGRMTTLGAATRASGAAVTADRADGAGDGAADGLPIGMPADADAPRGDGNADGGKVCTLAGIA